MEGDYNVTLEKENEYLKQTVYRLTLDLKSQKKIYEDEINYFKDLIDKHLKNLTTIERTKHDLQSKIKTLSSQLVECNEELVSKNEDIERLQGIIEKQKACISHNETLLKDLQNQQNQTQNEEPTRSGHDSEIDATVASLKLLADKITTQIANQDSRIMENQSLIQKLKQILELQVQQQIQLASQQHPTRDDTCFDKLRSMYEDLRSDLNSLKNQVNDDMTKLAEEVSELKEDSKEFNFKIDTMGQGHLSIVKEMQEMKGAQNDFLNLWL